MPRFTGAILTQFASGMQYSSYWVWGVGGCIGGEGKEEEEKKIEHSFEIDKVFPGCCLLLPPCLLLLSSGPSRTLTAHHGTL